MDRRSFLLSSSALAAAALPWRGASAAAAPWRTFEVVSRVEVVRAQGVSRAWVPLPLAEATEWQRPLGNTWGGNAARALAMTEDKYGVRMVYAEWRGEASPSLEVVSRFATRDRAVDLSAPAGSALAHVDAGDVPVRRQRAQPERAAADVDDAGVLADPRQTQQHGVPATPAQLEKHHCLATHHTSEWQFHGLALVRAQRALRLVRDLDLLALRDIEQAWLGLCHDVTRLGVLQRPVPRLPLILAGSAIALAALPLAWSAIPASSLILRSENS